jgi:hypothetical protein
MNAVHKTEQQKVFASKAVSLVGSKDLQKNVICLPFLIRNVEMVIG